MLPMANGGHGAPELFENGSFLRVGGMVMSAVFSKGFPVLNVVLVQRGCWVGALRVWRWGGKSFGEVSFEHCFELFCGFWVPGIARNGCLYAMSSTAEEAWRPLPMIES